MKKYDQYKNSGVEWLGEIPEHWETKRIKHLFKEINERSYDGSEDLLSVSQYTGVTNKSERLEDGGMLTNATTLEGYKIVSKDDLVSNIMLAWNGSLGFSPCNGITSPAYSIYRIKTNDINRYFHYLLRTELYKSEYKRNSSGVIESRLRLYTDDFFRIESILPPIKEQIVIANFLDEKTTKIDQAISIKQKQIELLKERRQILVHKAVTRGLDDNVKLKDSGVEWIGEIPEHWEVKRLKYLGNTFAGITGKSGEDFSKEHNEGFKPFVPFTSIFNNEIIDTSKHQFVNIRENEYQNKVKKGDLLFLMSSETLEDIGKCSIYLGMENELYLNSFCKGFRFSNPIINAVFTNHLLQSYSYRHYFSLKGRGFTRINIKQEFVLEIPILIPPLSEQKEISEYIENATTKIATAISLKEQEIEKLKEYKMSLIDGVVTGKVKVC